MVRRVEFAACCVGVTPLPGESLISWMEAYARACHVELREQLIAVGLHALRRVAALKALLRITWKADPSHVLAVIHDGGHDDVLAAICRIAEYLDAQSCPIDYERRRKVVGADLLPTEGPWREICRSTGSHLGHRDKAWRRMRGFLYQRITGSDQRHAGQKLSESNATLQARSGANPFRLTAPLMQALDEYAVDYLESKGINEPLLWEPPAHCADGLTLPGRDPQDIGISEVHRLLDIGTATSRVAELLDTSCDHVRLAIEQHPPRSLDVPRRRQTSGRAQRSGSTRLTEQFLRLEHVVNRKPIGTIAQETGYARAVIQERLRRFGLTQSKADQARIDENWLREQYLVQGRSQADIAAELGCCYPHVARSLKRLGIPTRSRLRNLDPPAGSPAILAPILSRLGGIDRLRNFEFTMRHGSIREAATALGVHESGVGQKLRFLEGEFGQPLFTRASTGLKGRHDPTVFGQAVLDALCAMACGDTSLPAVGF